MRRKKHGIYGYKCENQGEPPQQRHPNRIWQGDSEQLGLVAAPKGTRDAPNDPAPASGQPKAQGRTETRYTQTEAQYRHTQENSTTLVSGAPPMTLNMASRRERRVRCGSKVKRLCFHVTWASHLFASGTAPQKERNAEAPCPESRWPTGPRPRTTRSRRSSRSCWPSAFERPDPQSLPKPRPPD
jgi:hypothetical protein